MQIIKKAGYRKKGPPPFPYIFLLIFFIHSTFADQPILTLSTPTTKDMPPWTWIDKCTGKQTGVITQIEKHLFDSLGIKTRRSEPREISTRIFNDIASQLINHEIDASIATLKLINQPDLTYSQQHVVELQTSIIFRTNQSIVINSIEDLKPLNGVLAVIQGEQNSQTTTDRLSYLRGRGLNVSPSQQMIDETYHLLLNGQADYILSDPWIAKAYLHRKGLRKKFQVKIIPGMSRKLYTAMATDSIWISYMSDINQQLEILHDSGYIDRSIKYYLKRWLRPENCSISSKEKT